MNAICYFSAVKFPHLVSLGLLLFSLLEKIGSIVHQQQWNEWTISHGNRFKYLNSNEDTAIQISKKGGGGKFLGHLKILHFAYDQQPICSFNCSVLIHLWIWDMSFRICIKKIWSQKNLFVCSRIILYPCPVHCSSWYKYQRESCEIFTNNNT